MFQMVYIRVYYYYLNSKLVSNDAVSSLKIFYLHLVQKASQRWNLNTNKAGSDLPTFPRKVTLRLDIQRVYSSRVVF